MAKIVLPKDQSKKGSAFTYAEEKQLVDYCIAHPELTASNALLVLLYTGMRRSELQTLRIIDENWLECDTSKEKMGNGVVPRRIPITPMMRKVLPYINFEKAKQTNVNTIKHDHQTTVSKPPYTRTALYLHYPVQGVRHKPRTCHALGRAFVRQRREDFRHRKRLYRLLGKVRAYRSRKI